MKKYDTIARCVAAIVLIALAYLLTGCEAVGRGMKSLKSSAVGMERTLTAYSYTGDVIGSWTGKFDISNNEQGAIVFDIDGKRNMVYNAIVIVEEK